MIYCKLTLPYQYVNCVNIYVSVYVIQVILKWQESRFEHAIRNRSSKLTNKCDTVEESYKSYWYKGNIRRDDGIINYINVLF